MGFSIKYKDMYMICKLMSLITKPFDGSALLYIYMCVCVYMIMIMTMSWIFIFMVILRSTTGPYGRPMIEVAYGEMLFSLYRGCMGNDSSGRVGEMSTWCRPCWTYPDQHQCGLNVYCFLDFHTKNIKYISIVFKYIRSI